MVNDTRAFPIQEALTRLGISRTSLYKMASAGEIEIKKIGNRAVILSSEIERVLADAPVARYTGSPAARVKGLN